MKPRVSIKGPMKKSTYISEIMADILRWHFDKSKTDKEVYQDCTIKIKRSVYKESLLK